MARGTQLTQLVIMLREETSRSSSLSVGVSDLPELKRKIVRTQEGLYDEFDWPFLREVHALKQMQAASQYYDFPTTLNLERIEEVVVWYGNLPLPITRGISFSDYAIYNSANAITSSPVKKWDVRWTGTSEQMEVWPLPPDNTQYVQIIGIRKLRALVADSDVADLDDQLIVLTAAADILLRQGDPAAARIASKAASRKLTLQSRLKGASRTRRMGQGTPLSDSQFPITVHARAT